MLEGRRIVTGVMRMTCDLCHVRDIKWHVIQVTLRDLCHSGGIIWLVIRVALYDLCLVSDIMWLMSFRWHYVTYVIQVTLCDLCHSGDIIWHLSYMWLVRVTVLPGVSLMCLVLGPQISRMLIHSLINMYLGDNAATDAISHRLREVCPTLYSPEDAICSKVGLSKT